MAQELCRILLMAHVFHFAQKSHSQHEAWISPGQLKLGIKRICSIPLKVSKDNDYYVDFSSTSTNVFTHEVIKKFNHQGNMVDCGCNSGIKEQDKMEANAIQNSILVSLEVALFKVAVYCKTKLVEEK